MHEAAALAERFRNVNQAKFARDHKMPGGASMISQHLAGRRPLALEHALLYAKGFNVPLAAISQRLADLVASAQSPSAGSSLPASHASIALEDALPIVLDAFSKLAPLRWSAVRAQLDDLAGHPEMLDDALPELLHLLQSKTGKLQRAA